MMGQFYFTLYPDDDVELANLQVQIAQLRGGTFVFVRYWELGEFDQAQHLHPMICALVAHAGFTGFCIPFLELSFSEACNVMAHVLAFDLAYRGEIMPLNSANELVSKAAKFFPEGNSRFFTNASFEYSPFDMTCWSPLAPESTFDSGVIMINFADRRAGMLWVQDED